jgi:hypothetical protein
MKDAHDADADTDQETRYVRLPWRLVTAGLIALLAIVLGIGLYANRNLRPQVGLVPTPDPAVALPPVTATPQVALLTPTSVPTLVPAGATVPAAGATPAVAPTPAASIGVTPSARPTLDAVLVAEVTKAYERYWLIRSQAFIELDKTYLGEIMGGDHLDMLSHRIDELRIENRAIKTDVDHQYHVVQVNADTAQIIDDYISNSIYVDPATKLPLTEPAADELRVLYRLHKVDRKWIVVDSVRAD